MELKEYLPIWNKLSDKERTTLEKSVSYKKFEKGKVLHNGKEDCNGLFIVLSGKLRVYVISSGGREVTLYRLLERDICLFSASCILNSIQFDLIVQTQTQTEVLVIPSEIYKSLMKESAPLANFTNEIMSSRFSEVMWLLDQIMWKSFDKRLADFLIQESILENSETLKITHEEIGNHLGNPREVVTRMLKYFSKEGTVYLSRGKIKILDREGLMKIAKEE